ncbi:TonB family protein [Alistipes putredinis]|uniref:TonB family protein n=1 Tax=Alistipes putredinis TaxID=28117 RepID=UPI003AB248EE
MKEIVRYILETVVCSGILYGAYLLFLRNCTGYLAARLCLTGSLLAAALIPLLRIPVWPGRVIYATAGTPAETTFTEPAASAATFDYEAAIWIVYGCGVLLLLSSMFRQVLLIRRLRRHSTRERIGRIVLVRPTAQIASFSFFRTIYISRSVAEKDIAAIFAHEKSHVIHRHSLERIVMESLKALLWWNPFAWLTARALTEVEEFEADRDVLAEGHDTGNYLKTIFTQQFGYSPDVADSLSNSLTNSLTKKRIQMMTTPMKSRYALLRLIAMLPIVTGLLAAFGFTSKAAKIRIQDKLPSAYTPTDPPAETAEKTASPEAEGDDWLLVVNGEITDFKTDPATGLRSLTLGKGTYCIVETKDLTPEMREKYAAYLPGKTAVFFFEDDTTGKAPAVQILDETAPSPRIAVCKATLAREQTEQMPSFQSGDMKAFHNWVNSQIRYPAEAFKNNLGGKVVAQFTVDRAGSVGDIKILQSPDKCFSDEVTRILESSPKWTPGRDEKGDAVKVSLVIPVDFRMAAEKPSGN